MKNWSTSNPDLRMRLWHCFQLMRYCYQREGTGILAILLYLYTCYPRFQWKRYYYRGEGICRLAILFHLGSCWHRFQSMRYCCQSMWCSLLISEVWGLMRGWHGRDSSLNIKAVLAVTRSTAYTIFHIFSLIPILRWSMTRWEINRRTAAVLEDAAFRILRDVKTSRNIHL